MRRNPLNMRVEEWLENNEIIVGRINKNVKKYFFTKIANHSELYLRSYECLMIYINRHASPLLWYYISKKFPNYDVVEIALDSAEKENTSFKKSIKYWQKKDWKEE